MAERSFVKEAQKLRLGAGEEFRGEGILAVTKALLQSGVAYVGGYQGAPITHLVDVFSDAREILDELGVHFETSANEAAAAAMLAASINHPLRGAVTWKSTVGTNVATDALANISSAGVTGGALIIIGEDYGEGSSIVQERSHGFAMKSQIWLLDPRPDLECITGMVEKGFELSEASHTPVMLELRIRACHVYGKFTARDNRKPSFSAREALENPNRRADRITLPPHTYRQEAEKYQQRLPAAVEFIQKEQLNEFHDGRHQDVGIIVLGGLYNSTLRALELLGAADIYGKAEVPVYVLNVAWPLIDDEFRRFCAGKRAVLIIEEGQPDYIEQAANTILRRADIQTHVAGKDFLPAWGEYTGAVLKSGIARFLETFRPDASKGSAQKTALPPPAPQLQEIVPARPPNLCTGCPERPFFTAIKILQKEMGEMQVSADIGCHSFATLPPFNLGTSIAGYGLGPASASALNIPHRKRAISLMGDGGFWHSGLNSSIANAVENEHDGVIVIIDNGYSAATGGQWVPSSRAASPKRRYNLSIPGALKGVGVRWIRKVRTYDIGQCLRALRQAMQTKTAGPKVIVAEGECQLNRQRRIRPVINRMLKEGKRYVRQRFGVDADTCTGDHSCIRLSGCPSLTIRDNPDPLRSDPVAHVNNSCVGCGVCGEVAHAAVLCPSFYRADIICNPRRRDRLLLSVQQAIIPAIQRKISRRLEKYAF